MSSSCRLVASAATCGRPDRPRRGRQGPPRRSPRPDCRQDGRSAAVHRGTDQDGSQIRPPPRGGRRLCPRFEADAARDPLHARGFVDGPARSSRPVKDVAQIGAAIGREFSFRLLESVAPIKGADLEEALRQLEAAELVFTRGAPPEATYVFKHALVQDAAYQSLLKSRRQVLHQRIAESLTNRFPDRAEEEPSLVAHHFTQAGMPDAAIEWWERAGSQAMRRFANPEAVVSFGNALGLVPDVPSGAARDERELALRLAIGPALLAARGYASTEVERNYQEAETLADRLGDREAVFTSTRGLWHYFYDRGELDQALTLAQRLIAIGELDGSAERMSLALRALGSTLMSKGDFAGALHAFDRCLAEGAREMRRREPRAAWRRAAGRRAPIQGPCSRVAGTAQFRTFDGARGCGAG